MRFSAVLCAICSVFEKRRFEVLRQYNSLKKTGVICEKRAAYHRS